MPPQPLTVGELAARTGVATSALRFYEERGLIHAQRSAVGHRRYPRYAARRVAFIVFAQRIGLTLDEIAVELARLPTNRVPTMDDWDHLTHTWEARIDQRIAELRRLKGSLTDCIGCGCLSLQRCPVLNRDDRMAQQGAGPRYWMDEERPDADAEELQRHDCV